MVATPVTEAAAHFLSPPEVVRRYVKLIVESSLASLANFDGSDLRQLVDAVVIIATVAGTVEEFGLDNALVERLVKASNLPETTIRAVNLCKIIQLESSLLTIGKTGFTLRRTSPRK